MITTMRASLWLGQNLSMRASVTVSRRKRRAFFAATQSLKRMQSPRSHGHRGLYSRSPGWAAATAAEPRRRSVRVLLYTDLTRCRCIRAHVLGRALGEKRGRGGGGGGWWGEEVAEGRGGARRPRRICRLRHRGPAPAFRPQPAQRCDIHRRWWAGCFRAGPPATRAVWAAGSVQAVGRGKC
jgi:hypothetical protein